MKFGDKLEVTADNEYKGTVCTMLDLYEKEGVPSALLLLDNGAVMNAPVSGLAEVTA